MTVKRTTIGQCGKRAPGVLFGFLWLFLLAVFLTSGLTVISHDAAAQTVKNVRLGENAGKTRFVIDINRDVKFTYFLLADPYRVVIDLPEVKWNLDNAGRGEGRGLIEDYRYGLFQPGTSRLVLDLKEPAEVDRVFMLSPQSGYEYRLVLDLKPTERASFMTALEQRKEATKTAYSNPKIESTPKPAPSRRTVVIDAGHGGVDPGAISVIGVPEKNIVLDVAREVKKKLESTGNYRVLMTRNRDIFIPLGERVNFSREAGADLFISIHADSLKNTRIRGATVYTLSETASDREAAALAEKENKSDLIAGVDLGGENSDVANILVDLAMRETMNYSARFAGLLLPELKKYVTLRQNSHRFAGFRVLKAPDVPSVLLEIGYLSNKTDARQMTSPAGRDNLARAIRGAVDDYFSTVTAVSGY